MSKINIYSIFPDVDETIMAIEKLSRKWNKEVNTLLKKHHCRTADEVPEDELISLVKKYDHKLKVMGEIPFIS